MRRTYSKYVREATLLLGQHIKLRRKQRRWSESHLAERAGISRATLQRIERGEVSCAIGLVFEVAALVGVELFESDDSLHSKQHQINDLYSRMSLLPQRIRSNKKSVYDDF